MAKSGRHKKLRKQEKAKTQLKGRKTLAKVQNVVEPKLRAKKILIREQLKPASSSIARLELGSDDEVESPEITVEATTRKKQSLQDVLTSLNHHNKNIKKDALSGLIEIMTSQNALLSANLDRVLEKLGALTSDLEGIVRKENLRVSEVIFAQVKEEQVQPFWNLLLTHVKCTLTNFNPSIRYGCLSFLALLISYFPNLTASSNHIILPTLLNLVSTSGDTQQASGSSPKPTSSAGKSKLKIEISNQHNDSNERLRVLTLIASCLELEKKSICPATFSSNSSIQSKFNTYNSSSLYFPHGYQEFENNRQRLKFSFNDASLTGTNLENESSNFWPTFVQACLPVLWETWLEFRPSLKDETSDRGHGLKLEHGGRGNSSLSSVAVEYLKCIVTVMTCLVLQQGQGAAGSTIEQTDERRNDLVRILRKNHGQNLKKYFLNGLPYFATQDTQRKVLTSVNLELYRIASELRLIDAKLMKSFENYVRGLMGKSLLDAGQTAKVLDIVTLIRMERTGNVMGEVIDYALESEFYETVNSFLLQLLAVTRVNLNTTDNFIIRAVDWNNVINQLLVQNPSLNSDAVQILTLIGLRRLCDFSTCMEDNFPKFEDFLKQEEDSLQAWDLVVRLFYVMNRIDYFEKEKERIVPPVSIQSVTNQLLQKV